jgi:hypothetical protein
VHGPGGAAPVSAIRQGNADCVGAQSQACDPAASHQHDTVRDGQRIGKAVGDEQHGLACVGQSPKVAEHRVAVVIVEAAGQLIRDDEVGIAERGDREHHPACHPARELLRKGAGGVRTQMVAVERGEDCLIAAVAAGSQGRPTATASRTGPSGRDG